MNKIIKLFLLWAVIMLALPANAQRRISGTVSDDIDVIIGANVKEVDKNNRILNAAVTDFNGNFTMTLKDDKSKLVISYMGYKTVTVPTAGKTVFKITMQDDSKTMKDLIVEGKKLSGTTGLEIPEREYGGTVQSFDMSNVEGLAFTSVDQALQGQIAGLDIVANSGNAGAGTTMRLRGISTLNAGDGQPLIVVNGDPKKATDLSGEVDVNDLDNEEKFAELLNVNPEDIQKITVLKDAASTAKYGTDGSNGVIEITLKRGKRGPTAVNFSYKFAGNWQPEGYKMLNGDEYTMYMKESYFNPTNTSKSILELDYNNTYESIFHNYNKNTDWVNAVRRMSKSHKYNINLNGGGEKAAFYISASYDKEHGTNINQDFERFTTSTALDYWVSDRITVRTDINMVFGTRHNNMVANAANSKAWKAMPNMAIYAHDTDGNMVYDEFGNPEYFHMLPLATDESYSKGIENDGLHTSWELRDMFGNGNAIAYANLKEDKQKNYDLSPKLSISYKLLGKSDDEWRLDYRGDVLLGINNSSTDSYTPSEVINMPWMYGGSNGKGGYNNERNQVTNSESKTMSFSTSHSLYFYSAFKNTKHKLSAEANMRMGTSNYSSQNTSIWNVPDGVQDPTSPGMLYSASASCGNSRWQRFYLKAHYAYDGKYILDASLTFDGNANFGGSNRFGRFPGFSARWNISDEKWMKWSEDWLSMLGVKASWGYTGNGNIGSYPQYNKYSSSGIYNGHTVIIPENLSLHNARWERNTETNLGLNVGFLKNMFTADVAYYHRKTTDMLNHGLRIPSANGFSSLGCINGGVMSNRGWELYINTDRFAKVGKFSMRASVNFAQNFNSVEELNSLVLENLNGSENYQPSNLSYQSRVQIGNALSSIYGLRYKGVYRYDYDHNGHTIQSWSDYGYNETIVVNGETRPAKDYTEFLQYKHTASGRDMKGNPINTAAAAQRRGENSTCPIAFDANGNMLTDAKGNPLAMYYCYNNDGGTRYQFNGGDVMYEDVNSDGQIDRYDMVYLGNSNPKLNGGGSVTFFYDKLTLNLGFQFRMGGQIVNLARQTYESMTNNNNQSYAVTWRWRKNGDITEIPRAINTQGTGAYSYNSLPNDRFVENGDYFKFSYIQLRYSMDPKKFGWMKKCGIKNLNLSASVNNIFTLSKYSGLSPEISSGGYHPATDGAKVPPSKSFQCSVNLGF